MMAGQRIARGLLLATLLAVLAGCGGMGNMFSRPSRDNAHVPKEVVPTSAGERPGSSFFDLFSNKNDPNTTVEVNKYIWLASLEVLDFLPKEQVDPFSGVIVTGYGTPPGGGRAYRATVLVNDPALDARSLKLSLESRGGAVPKETVRAVEDAILTRARQLRIRDSKL